MENKCQRENMLKGLSKNYLLVGNDRNDIIKLLGKPDGELDSIQRIPKHTFWDNRLMIKADKNSTKKDSLLYRFYSESCSIQFVNIDSYTCDFNGSGYNYIFIIYDKNNKLIDYKLGKTEF